MKKRCRAMRSEEHTSELQSPCNLVCRLLLEKKKKTIPKKKTLCKRDSNGKLRIMKYRQTLYRVAADRLSRSCLPRSCRFLCFFFFFNDTATTEIYTLSLHDALPI